MQPHQVRTSVGWWTTKDNRVLLIASMNEQHIRNCIRMIRRSKIKCREIMRSVPSTPDDLGEAILFDMLLDWMDAKIDEFNDTLERRGLEREA